MGRALFEKPPNKEEMAAAGLTENDIEVVEVWPENVQALDLLMAMQTQWRAGAAGVIGLDHNILFKRLERLNLTPEEFDQLDRDVRVMELAALEAINEKQP